MKRIRLVSLLIPLVFVSLVVRGYEFSTQVDETIQLGQLLPIPAGEEAGEETAGEEAKDEAATADDDQTFVRAPTAQLAEEPETAPTAQAGGGRAAFRDDAVVDQGLSSLDANIRNRQQTLDQREEGIQIREAMLRVAEERIQQQEQALKAVESSNSEKLLELKEARDKQQERLVSIYTNMKAKDAAEVFNGLDTQIIVSVLNRMATRNVGPILAEMDPAKAREVTEALRQLSTAQ